MQIEKKRRRLMLPEDEPEDEPSGKWLLTNAQRIFLDSTKSPGSNMI
jgi:hypothetical protein